MPRGSAHGWGIAGTYLAAEIAKLPTVEGVTLHCIAGHDFRAFYQDAWDRINIGYCFFEHELLAYPYIAEASKKWDHIVAGSSWCEYHLRKGGMDKTSTILQGIDATRFFAQPPRYDDGRFIVFSGGKFEFRKGQDIVIAAMRVFMQRHSDVWLSCAWHNAWPNSLKTMQQSRCINFSWRDAPCHVLLQETLAQNGLDPARVLLHPPFDNSRMSPIYTESTIGIFPNRCEGGNNMVMCEYMACGRPVIASTQSGHADVVTNDNSFCLTSYHPIMAQIDQHDTGVWFEPSVEELLEQLESAYRDRTQLESKGVRAASDMGRLTWSSAAKQFHALAEQLVDKYSRAGHTTKTFEQELDTAERLFECGNYDEAASHYRHLIALIPLNADLYNGMATVLDCLGRYREAVAYYEKALLIRPDFAIARFNLANTLARMGDTQNALEQMQAVVKDRPDFAQAWRSLALFWCDKDNFNQAAVCFQAVLALEPDNLECRTALGNMFIELGQYPEAVHCFDLVLNTVPDDVGALNSKGIALQELDDLDGAEQCYRHALAITPSDCAAINNLGTVLRSKGLPEAAIDCFNKALEIEPDSGQLLFNRVLARLSLGEYAGGWSDYEARFAKQVPVVLHRTDLPRWQGEMLQGRTLLVQSEQGYGDTLQFVRYLPLLERYRGRIVFECQDTLIKSAVSSIPGSAQIIARGEAMPAIDLQIPLLSLPLVFATDLTTIPSAEGYLSPDEERVAHWSQVLDPASDAMRVGLVWGGRRNSLNANRSMLLSDLGPLLDVPDIRYYSLQLGPDAEQTKMYADKLIDITGSIRDFGDTAAIISQLDLVITIDSAVAHLAGALGAPGWIMLKHAPDWRWLLSRDDSPWYSSLQLFRQKEPGNWDSVTGRLVEALRKMKATRKKC